MKGGRERRRPAPAPVPVPVPVPQMAEVQVSWQGVARAIPDSAVRRAAREALRRGKRPGIELSVAFVDDPTLAGLHGRHLGDPSPTDVISFDLGGGPGPAGEVVVSVDRARAEARRRGLPLRRELLLYVVHGVLHLCGHDDRRVAARRRMRAAERAVLAVAEPAARPSRRKKSLGRAPRFE